MLRLMCGIILRDRNHINEATSAELMDCLRVVSGKEVVTNGRLKHYGHVKRKYKSDWVSACRELQVEKTKGKRKSRTTLYI